MREKQIEKVSQRLFIVTSILAVSLLLLSAVVYPDLPAHVPIYVNFWDEGNSFGPRYSIFMWPTVLFALSIYQRSYQSVQPYGGWLKVFLIIVNLALSMFTVAGPLTFFYQLPFWYTWLTVGLGELLSMTVGGILIYVLNKKIQLVKRIEE